MRNKFSYKKERPVIGTHLKRLMANEDFPAPVLPTTPTFSPSPTEQVIPLSTSPSPGLYLVL